MDQLWVRRLCDSSSSSGAANSGAGSEGNTGHSSAAGARAGSGNGLSAEAHLIASPPADCPSATTPAAPLPSTLRARHEWHLPATGERTLTLPRGACTACGWRHSTASGLWKHRASGAWALAAPALVGGGEAEAAALAGALARGEGYSRAGLEGGGGASSVWERRRRREGGWVWLEEGTGIEANVLPRAAARTQCGWWQVQSGLWVHWGSGAVSESPPSAVLEDALGIIRAHLRVMLAASLL